MKKNGGIITNWQFHTLSAPLNKFKEIYPDITTDKPYIFTGIVKEDPTGRWEPGYHMKSSMVISYDKQTQIVETANTIYQLEGESGDPCTGGDIGDVAMSIFY